MFGTILNIIEGLIEFLVFLVKFIFLKKSSIH